MSHPLIGRPLSPHPSRLRRVLLAAAGLAGLLASGSAAQAALILSGNSTGSTLSNCMGTACSSSGTVTSLGLSSYTLSISPALNPFSVSAPPTTTTGVGLAELEMVTGNNPSGTASFNYNLQFNFTTPSGMFSQTIPLTLSASGNGSNSVETLSGFPSSLTGFPSLPGVTVSNFAFATAGGTVGSGNVFSGNTWTIPRGSAGVGSTAFLDLTATVTSTAVATPEPASLALLATALAGLGVLARRRRHR